MKNCVLTHSTCGTKSIKVADLPTRLIYIDDTSDNTVFRLIHPATDEIEGAKYAALSYCCGTDQLLKLTEDTFQTFCKGVPVDVLPRTYQGSMTVCQWLEIKYLWIDALCIIQDSNEDWIKEAGTMC